MEGIRGKLYFGRTGSVLMYLHIGNNKIIRHRDIVGIFDLDNATVSSVSRAFLRQAQKSGKLISKKRKIMDAGYFRKRCPTVGFL